VASRAAVVVAVLVVGFVIAGAGPAQAASTDWWHAVQVVSDLGTTPPAAPVVILLGGSAARECTVSDTSWAGQIVSHGGPQVAAYNIACGSETLEQDIALVTALPQQMPAVVYIGMNLGRFLALKPTVPTVCPEPRPELAAKYCQHHYAGGPLSPAKKRQLVREWMANQYPKLKYRWTYNLTELKLLLKLCNDRELHPVLLDMPRDMAIIGTAFNVPLQRYYTTCKAVAAQYHTAFVRLGGAAKLINTDFYDLAHLLKPGQVKWQRRLSISCVARLAKAFPPPAPPATPSDTPPATPSDTPPATPSDTPPATPSDTPPATPSDTPTTAPADAPSSGPTDSSPASASPVSAP
jgi:hypothetical protein